MFEKVSALMSWKIPFKVLAEESSLSILMEKVEPALLRFLRASQEESVKVPEIAMEPAEAFDRAIESERVMV